MTYCQHGFFIDYPLELTATRCPYCYPERPPFVPEGEWGDWVAFGWTNTIRGVVKSRGWILARGDTDRTNAVRQEQVEDLMSDCRAYLLGKRDVLTKVATEGLPPKMVPLRWDSTAMRAYVKRILQARLIDIQQRSSEWKVQYHTDPFIQMADSDTDTGDAENLDISSAPTAQTAADFHGNKIQQGADANEQTRISHPSLTIPSDVVRRIDVERALERIGESEREAFLARCLGERWSEVAEILNTTERTARRRVKAAEEALREVMA